MGGCFYHPITNCQLLQQLDESDPNFIGMDEDTETQKQEAPGAGPDIAPGAGDQGGKGVVPCAPGASGAPVAPVALVVHAAPPAPPTSPVLPSMQEPAPNSEDIQMYDILC